MPPHPPQLRLHGVPDPSPIGPRAADRPPRAVAWWLPAPATETVCHDLLAAGRYYQTFITRAAWDAIPARLRPARASYIALFDAYQVLDEEVGPGVAPPPGPPPRPARGG